MRVLSEGLFECDWAKDFQATEGDYLMRWGPGAFMAEVTAVHEETVIDHPHYGYVPEARVDCGRLIKITKNSKSGVYIIKRSQVPHWLREEIAEARNDPYHVVREKLLVSFDPKRLVVTLAPERPSKKERQIARLQAISDECLGAEAKHAIEQAIAILQE